jgi:hypothetical protein
MPSPTLTAGRCSRKPLRKAQPEEHLRPPSSWRSSRRGSASCRPSSTPGELPVSCSWSCTIANGSLLLFTLSAANSDQYIATRTLYGMAKDGNAPRIFTKCTKRGVPW